MIHTLFRIGGQLSSIDDLPEQELDAQVIWLEVNAPSGEESAALRGRFKIETRRQVGNVVEDGDLLYLRSQLIELDPNDKPRFASITFVLGDRVVATISDDADFRP